MWVHLTNSRFGLSAAILASIITGHSALPSFRLPSLPTTPFYRQAGAESVDDMPVITWTEVFSGAQNIRNGLPLVYVDGPCLIMFQQKAPNRVRISIANIELEMSEQPGLAVNRSITLLGTWRIVGASAGVQLRPTGATTTLTFLLAHGQTANVGLEKVGS